MRAFWQEDQGIVAERTNWDGALGSSATLVVAHEMGLGEEELGCRVVELGPVRLCLGKRGKEGEAWLLLWARCQK